MKIYCILREKIWNLNFNKLWKPRSIFFADSEHYFPSHLLKLHFRALRIVLLKEKIAKKIENQKTFRRLRANFLKMFSELHSTCPERHFELIFFAKLQFSRNFAVSFSAMLSKKQSSCPEKELWKTKFEKGSKIKQLFSDFDQNVSAG